MKSLELSNLEQAFTRLELASVLSTLALLTAIALPTLGGNKARSEQALCFSNLRQIGHAFHLWASDHGDRNPWLTPVQQGGTYNTPDPRKSDAWFQMSWISNELITPKILVCPSDVGVGADRKMATDFSSAEGGFVRLGFRSRSLSYVIGLHSFYDAPRSVLSGDRNFRPESLDNSCSTGVGAAWLLVYPNSSTVWTNAIHRETGNLLFTEGSVELSSNLGLRRAINVPNQVDNTGHHFLTPP